MACRMAGDGLVTVSLRKSMTGGSIMGFLFGDLWRE
jgi:hypothetical protein